jgi:hypothetical protein
MHPLAGDPRLPSPDYALAFHRRLACDPYPHRNKVLIDRKIVNEYGREFTYRVRSNWAGRRFWLEILLPDSKYDCASTTSKRIADGWIAAITEGANHVQKS